MNQNQQKQANLTDKGSKYERREAKLNLIPIKSKDINADIIALQITNIVTTLQLIEPMGMDLIGTLADIVSELYDYVEFKTGKQRPPQTESWEQGQKISQSAYNYYIKLQISILYSMLAMLCEVDISKQDDNHTQKALTPLLDYAQQLIDIIPKYDSIHSHKAGGANE